MMAEIWKGFHEIYLPERESKKYFGVSVLDVRIKTLDGKFILGVYDKSVSFPFFIVPILYLSSNISSKIFYASQWTEIFQIFKTAIDSNKFK